MCGRGLEGATKYVVVTNDDLYLLYVSRQAGGGRVDFKCIPTVHLPDMIGTAIIILAGSICIVGSKPCNRGILKWVEIELGGIL